jgi:hypothetical protein
LSIDNSAGFGSGEEEEGGTMEEADGGVTEAEPVTIGTGAS